ncbi:hypothetical protein T459_15394 [Capsicum annuum]|uniref:Uncharacterized protein n=1 Tax=Capsicum annuum TaxID=4072 RepID=A0A2G2ZK73_CAPAN|nr:hypothetical protein T459_15394 [Capsicum annuum]
MDSILYKAATEGNTGDGDFLLADYLNRDEENGYQVLLHGVDVARQAVGINKETLMRMTDDSGDTALHKAVKTGCVDTVRLLVKQDPDFEFPANSSGETL